MSSWEEGQLMPAGQCGMEYTWMPGRARLSDPLHGAEVGSTIPCSSTMDMKCVREACVL